MAPSPTEFPVYLETGRRRTFAGAIDWPGWNRSGQDEPSALEALLSYGPRYARVLQTVSPDLQIPSAPSELTVTERLEGNATTDFGAPAAVPAADGRPIDGEDLGRLAALLGACWQAFDGATQAAEGKSLRKGPRGGGGDLPGIVQHVTDANRAYLSKLSWKPALDPCSSPEDLLKQLLDEALKALAAGVAGELPSKGARGGKLWVPRYFVRRAAWHMLDHTWEIEDRAI